jgi:RNA polymerase sigma factor for flagellar operon FliA
MVYPRSGRMSDPMMHALMGRVRTAAFRLKQRLPPHIDVNDLVSAGYLGLTRALEQWKEDAGPGQRDGFEVYALQRARGAMLDELRGVDQLSRDNRKLAREIAAVERDLTRALNRPPESEEVAAKLDMSPASLAHARAVTALREQVSLSALEAVRSIPAPYEQPERALSKAQRDQKIKNAMDALPERLREVLRLALEENMTLKEIGERLGVTEARAWQLRRSAEKRLQELCKDTLIPPVRPSFLPPSR